MLSRLCQLVLNTSRAARTSNVSFESLSSAPRDRRARPPPSAAGTRTGRRSRTCSGCGRRSSGARPRRSCSLRLRVGEDGARVDQQVRSVGVERPRRAQDVSQAAAVVDRRDVDLAGALRVDAQPALRQVAPLAAERQQAAQREGVLGVDVRPADRQHAEHRVDHGRVEAVNGDAAVGMFDSLIPRVTMLSFSGFPATSYCGRSSCPQLIIQCSVALQRHVRLPDEAGVQVLDVRGAEQRIDVVVRVGRRDPRGGAARCGCP